MYRSKLPNPMKCTRLKCRQLWKTGTHATHPCAISCAGSLEPVMNCFRGRAAPRTGCVQGAILSQSSALSPHPFSRRRKVQIASLSTLWRGIEGEDRRVVAVRSARSRNIAGGRSWGCPKGSSQKGAPRCRMPLAGESCSVGMRRCLTKSLLHHAARIPCSTLALHPF
jgi:hypothetical protein